MNFPLILNFTVVVLETYWAKIRVFMDVRRSWLYSGDLEFLNKPIINELKYIQTKPLILYFPSLLLSQFFGCFQD